MISQADIQNSLKEIWQIFSAAGVTDPLTIMENLAYFFLREEFQFGQMYEIHASSRQLLETKRDSRGGFIPSDLVPDLCRKIPELNEISDVKQLVPQFTNSLGIKEFLTIGDAVHSLLQEGPSAAEIVNEIFPGFLDRMEPGGRYFTPRHLTRWATSLLDYSQETNLADFACGSGGFLVSLSDKVLEFTGVELSPNWARLAFANCLLHGIKKPNIHIGNSLLIFGKQEKDVLFDRILMNPSFGSKVDESLVRMVFDYKLSNRSETVLTALAYKHLNENGQMVLFLPSGSLFANSGGELELRMNWIENGELTAVVTFPQDAFQPYSQVTTHAIIVNKTNPHPDATWFFTARYDGYTTGRNRQEDPDHNDLPLISAAIQEEKNKRILDAAITENPIIVRSLTQDDQILGYQFVAKENSLIRIDRLEQQFPVREIDFLIGTEVDGNHKCAILNEDQVVFGENIKKEFEIPLWPIPDRLNIPIKIDFAEEWNFSLELTPEIVTYFDADRTEKLTFLKELNFQQPAGIMVYEDGKPFTPAFSLPNSFYKPGLGIYYWLEDVDRPGMLLTIPPINQAPVFVFKDEYITKYLFILDQQFALGINVDQNNQVDFEVYQTSKIDLGNFEPSGVVVDQNGTLLGLKIPASKIKSNNFDCQPSTYFPGEKKLSSEYIKSPAEILADLQNSQFLLSHQINKLLSLAEMKSLAKDTHPSRIEISPLGDLQGIQKTIWEEIELMINKSRQKEIPKPFRLGDIRSALEKNYKEKFLDQNGIEWDEELGVDPYTADDMEEYAKEHSYEAEIQRTLDLYEKMGVLVRISINGSEYYRLTSAQEKILGDEQ